MTAETAVKETEKQEEIPREYVEMTFVKETATGRGRNEIFIMENMHNGTMKITEGRIGITVGRYKPKVTFRPISDWDNVYQFRIGRGYMATKTKKMEKVEVKKGLSGNSNDYDPIADPKVENFVNELLAYAKKVFETSYTVHVDNISDEMIELGDKILKELVKGQDAMSIAEFNNKLKLLYAVIPRRMDKLSSHLARHKEEFAGIVSDEQDLFDIMVSQVRNGQKAKQAKGETILDANKVSIRPVTGHEEAFLKGLLGSNSTRYLEAYRLKNEATEEEFNDYADIMGLTEEDGIAHLFHGTRHENVWSIITTGIKNRPPKDTVITGKAYGMGSYFAVDAQKSLGYTSRDGAKWTNGGSDYGFLFVCKVAIGPEGTYYDGHLGCDPSLNAEKLETIAPGALCTWAKARYSGFRMDEIIVYQDCQSTIEYIIKMA